MYLSGSYQFPDAIALGSSLLRLDRLHVFILNPVKKRLRNRAFYIDDLGDENEHLLKPTQRHSLPHEISQD